MLELIRMFSIYPQILSQCTARLGLTQAAVRMFTEDGTMIVEVEDMIDWAVQNYRSLMADHLEKIYQGKGEGSSLW